MADYSQVYESLNSAQRQAVDHIDGPLLVVAGPGTGKTQLLSARAAHILQATDSRPENILCLTFTDKAATNMRERMLQIIGPEARKIMVKTFHGLGAEIINQYPHYFFNAAQLEPAPEAVKLELIDELLTHLPLDNPLALKFAGQNTLIGDVQKGIAQAKDAGLTPAKLKAVAESNLAYLDALDESTLELLGQRLSKKQFEDYQQLIDSLPGEDYSIDPIVTYSSVLKSSLQSALDESRELNKTAPLSQWKKEWLETQNGQKAFKDIRRNQWWLALSQVYDQYQQALHQRGYFDFADMILEVIVQLEQNETLRSDIQERFEHIMLDEFQDTNDAQFRLSYLIASNPVHEGRPNIMAVGDDDQAIYRFQGAELSNIQRFIDSFRDTSLVVLTDNYRSHQAVLNTGGSIADKISHRLSTNRADIVKEVVAQSQVELGDIEHLSYPAQAHQFTGVAQRVKTLFGHKYNSIAILARGHDSLQRMAYILQQYQVPVRYERRANILEHPAVLLTANVVQLLDKIQNGDPGQVSALLKHILAAEAFGFKPKQLWQFAVVNRFQDDWLSALVESHDPDLNSFGQWLMELGQMSQQQPLAIVIEHVLGLRNTEAFASPIKQHYIQQDDLNSEYTQTLSALQRLRSLVAEFARESEPSLHNFVAFLELNREHGVVIADESAFVSGEQAVELMTVHKAKGLEFDCVFIIDAVENQWQPRKRSRIPAVKNLEMLQAYGEDEDDYARLLFVAATRAKSHLTFTSFRSNEAGRDVLATPLLLDVPTQEQNVEAIDQVEVAEQVSSWPQLKNNEQEFVLKPLLEGYQLSVTHLLNFIDLERGGPDMFVTRNLLRLPEVKSSSLAFGSALHKALQHAQSLVNSDSYTLSAVEQEFAKQLHKQQLLQEEEMRYQEHGQQLLRKLLEGGQLNLPKGGLPERSIKQVRIGDAVIRGELDRVDQHTDEVIIVDYKTGAPLTGDITNTTKTHGMKALKHRTQLIFYALLAREGGLAKPEQTVTGQMLYLESDTQKHFTKSYTPSEADLDELKQLIEVVWSRIMNLDWPDVSGYSQDFAGTMQFIGDLKRDD